MSAARKIFDAPGPTLSVVGRKLDIVDRLNIVGKNGIHRRLVAGDEKVRAYSVAELRKLGSIRARRGPLPDDRAKVLPFSPPFAAASIVQTCHGNAGGGTGSFTSISATWSTGNTTALNTIFAIFGFEGSVTGSITFPNATQGNWTGVTEVTGSPWQNGTTATLRVFQLNSAPQQTTAGAQTFTISGSTAGVILVEVGGLGSSATLDSVSAGANPTTVDTGSSASPATNAMTATNGATDLYMACYAVGNTSGATGFTFNTPTNSFAGLVQDAANHTTVPHTAAGVAMASLVGNAGSTSTGVSMNQSGIWVGILLAFKAAASTSPLAPAVLSSYPGVWNAFRANPFDLLP